MWATHPISGGLLRSDSHSSVATCGGWTSRVIVAERLTLVKHMMMVVRLHPGLLAGWLAGCHG